MVPLLASSSLFQLFSVFYLDEEIDMNLWQPLAVGWILSHLYLATLVSPALEFVKYEEERNQVFWDQYWEEREADEALAAE